MPDSGVLRANEQELGESTDSPHATCHNRTHHLRTHTEDTETLTENRDNAPLHQDEEKTKYIYVKGGRYNPRLTVGPHPEEEEEPNLNRALLPWLPHPTSQEGEEEEDYQEVTNPRKFLTK